MCYKRGDLGIIIPQMIVNKTMRDIKSSKIQGLTLLLIGCDKTNIEALSSDVFSSFCLPEGKPMIHHLLCCRGFAVDDYSFTLGRLGAGASQPEAGKPRLSIN